MGNSHGGNRTQEKIDLLNARSGQGNSQSPDTVTLKGFNSYINQNNDLKHDTWVPQLPHERVKRYHDIDALSKEIGMSDRARDKIMQSAYTSLNRKGDLESAGIADPATARREEPRSRAEDSTRTHPQSEETVKQVKALLSNPHSYFSLSGEKLESLLQKEPGKLGEAIHADQTFVQATKDHWNLDPGQRAQTAANVRNNYNEELCTGQLHLAGTSNRTPIDNFMKGKEAAINAVEQGFNIYGGQNQEALKAFGQVAMSVNNAINSSHTLAGRGADTISEQTMSHNPDGHNQSGPKKH
jgi:hypothetical protein